MKKLAGFATDAEREAFESQCLADGWIAPRQKGGRQKERDPFDDIADKIQSQREAMDHEADVEAAEIQKQLDKRELADRVKGKTKTAKRKRKSG